MSVVVDPLGQVYEGDDPALREPVVSYWKPEIAVHIVTDFKKYPLRSVPPLVFPSLRIKQQNKKRSKEKQYYYMPVMYVDETGLTTDKFIPLNRSTISLPLRISYKPMTFARYGGSTPASLVL